MHWFVCYNIMIILAISLNVRVSELKVNYRYAYC